MSRPALFGSCTTAGLPPQGPKFGPQSSTRRWSVLVECVTALNRIMEMMDSGWLDVTVSVPPTATEAVFTDTVGRVAGDPLLLKRYGGDKIWASAWLTSQPPQRPPPPSRTRPSLSRMPVEWYVRGTECWASMAVHSSVSGSQISAPFQLVSDASPARRCNEGI